jgi:hypothetical protein
MDILSYLTKVNTNKKDKRVQFTEKTFVHMYPNINTKDLWWTPYDYHIANQSANIDIYRLMSIHPYMTIRQARKLLYQPNNISYNETNFEHNIFM